MYNLIIKNTVSPKFINEFYKHSDFISSEAKFWGGEVKYFHFVKDDMELVIPLIKRKVFSGPYYDLTSPYGYPGIYCNKDVVDLTDVWSTLDKYCVENGIISSFIRLHPIYNNFLINENKTLRQIIHGKIVTIPLRKPYDSLYSDFSSNHRRGIKKLKKLGYTVLGKKLSAIGEFKTIYDKAMRALNASDYYYFNLEYYEVLSSLPFDVKLYFVENEKSESVSCAIFVGNGEILHYHLGGTLGLEVKNSPNKLIFDEVIRDHSGKYKWLNLGGGLGNEQDSLFKFKNGFSSSLHTFSTVRMVHLKDQYNNLCKGLNIAVSKDLAVFFPEYRI